MERSVELKNADDPCGHPFEAIPIRLLRIVGQIRAATPLHKGGNLTTSPNGSIKPFVGEL